MSNSSENQNTQAVLSDSDLAVREAIALLSIPDQGHLQEYSKEPAGTTLTEVYIHVAEGLQRYKEVIADAPNLADIVEVDTQGCIKAVGRTLWVEVTEPKDPVVL